MTDSTINQDTNARLDLLTEQLEKLQGTFLKFSNHAVEILSGQKLNNQPSNGAQQPSEATIVKRGPRRPKEVVETSAHPTQVQALNLIMKRGKISVPDLADEIKEKRELMHHHVNQLAREGKCVEVVHFPQGRRTVFAYRPDWTKLKQG